MTLDTHTYVKRRLNTDEGTNEYEGNLFIENIIKVENEPARFDFSHYAINKRETERAGEGAGEGAGEREIVSSSD